MSAHTPGPWHWDSDRIKGDPLGRFRCRVTTIGKTITQCYYSSDDEHAEHDARLIAAAPELLEAGIDLLSRQMRSADSTVERRLRNAIAKATEGA